MTQLHLKKMGFILPSGKVGASGSIIKPCKKNLIF